MSSTPRTPPRWIDQLLEWLIRDYFLDEILGDLNEWYDLNADKTRFILNIKYFLVALRSLKRYRLKTTQNIILYLIDMSIFNNNFRVGMRSILKNRLFSSINLIGLTTALTAALFIYAYVLHEISYHSFHPKADSIFRIINHYKPDGSLSRSTTSPLVPSLLNEFPGSAQYARFGQDPVYVNIEEASFYEGNFYWADSTLFTIFDLEFLYGSKQNALNAPNKIVLTEEVSTKYFGEGVNPVGKILEVKVYDGNQVLSMQVDGVLRKMPSNQDFPFEVLGSISNALDMYKQFENSWSFSWLHTYALIEDPIDFERINAGTGAMLEKHLGAEMASEMELVFQPLKETHLYSQDIRGARNDGNIKYVIAIGAIGIFILLIASINYINMMTARLYRRGKEVGIRKFNGASKPQLIKLFLTESGIVVFASGIVAFSLAWLMWEPFTVFVSKEIPMSLLVSKNIALSYLVAMITLVILAGGYPAWILSRLDMLKMIRGVHEKLSRVQLRRVLVVLQFGISAFLILCTMVIWNQVSYMSNKSLGFNKEQLVVVQLESKDLQAQIDVIKGAMSNVSGVISIAASGESLPSEMNNTWGIEWAPEKRMPIDVVTIDPQYFETIQTKILNGNNLTLPFKSDSARSIVINESAVDAMNLDEPIGKTVNLGGRNRRIVGVVQDFHYQSLQTKMEPVAYMIGTPGHRISADNLIVRIKPSEVSSTIGQMEKVWDSFSRNEVFNFKFVDESYQNAYESETRFLQLLGAFAVLSILVACIGLFGMVVFITDERSKELSIRKVLGAGVYNIVMLVSKEFTLLVLIGFVIALPLGILVSENWLERFPYRTEISILIIVAAAGLSLLIAWLTIGFNTVKTALSNPVKFLRNE
jgi:putative ABC transport system permease protein